MRTVLPAAVTMIAYSLSMLFVGVLAWMVAPPGVATVTALVAPIVTALAVSVCAIMLLRVGTSRGLALAGLYLGIAIPLVVALGAGWRLRGSLSGAGGVNEAGRQPSQAPEPPAKGVAPELYPAAYQALGLGATIALSGLAFVALLATARRIPWQPAPVADAPAPVPPSSSTAQTPVPIGMESELPPRSQS